MRVFITGGSGFIGQRLAEKLLAGNNEVVLLLRDPERARKLLHAGYSVISQMRLNNYCII
ncbi:MAG: SDR family oxidoreductase [Bacteroidales bacterium]